MIQRLRRLGFDKRNLRALPLLPLVEVAWADGRLQRREVEVIRAKADEHELRHEDRRMLENWLKHSPSPAYVRSAHGALAWLAEHGDPAVDPKMIRDILPDAKQVAAAAGGLLGIGAVCKAERDTLSRLASDLVAPPAEDEPPSEEDAHPDFVRKNAVVTLAYTPGAEDEGEAVLVPQFGPPLRLPVRADGLAIGSGDDADVRIEGDPEVARLHGRLFSQAGEYLLRALGGPLWVNGERIEERRLLGGETIRITAAASFTFKWVRPVT
jgi:hypothetical protein